MITINDISETKPKFYRRTPINRWGNIGLVEIPQEKFLCELDPLSHDVNNPLIYENITKLVPRKDYAGRPILDENGQPQMMVTEIDIERVCIPIQKVIETKHTTNITANQTKIKNIKRNPSEEDENIYVDIKNGWITKNMETCKYQFIKSVNTVGDGAVCIILHNNKVSYKVFSYLYGDVLHPIFDKYDNISIFGREYTVYDYSKKENIPYLDVWDKKNLYTYKYSLNEEDKVYQPIAWDEKDNYNTIISDIESEGWELVSYAAHGFNEVPISYLKRDSGACWSAVQDLIDKLEIALSQLAENNKSYAFRIMKIKGGFEIQGDIKGQARAILLDEQAEAGFMEKADASETFKLQIDNLFENIKLGSFIVIPPEINGDTSGVTVKILYSPSQEKGIEDINFFNKSIDDIFRIFKHALGIEKGNITGYDRSEIRADLSVYIPQNEYERQRCLEIGVRNGFLSHESAAEQNTEYGNPDEKRRLIAQDKYETEMETDRQRSQLVGNI